MTDERESDADSRLEDEGNDVNDGNNKGGKKHKRIVVRINVLNHQELTRNNRSCGACIVCFLSKDSLEERVNQIVGQQVHDDMKVAGLETTWSVEGKQIRVEIRDQNRYVQQIAKGIVESEVRKELSSRGVEFELSVKREKVDKNKIPKRLVVRVSISSIDDFAIPTPDPSQQDKTKLPKDDTTTDVVPASSPPSALSAIKRLSTGRQPKKAAKPTKAQIYSEIEQRLSQQLKSAGHENIAIADPEKSSIKIIIVNHAHWGFQWLNQNFIQDKVEQELKAMNVVSLVNIKRELVEELA